jgi:hypothetical protein
MSLRDFNAIDDRPISLHNQPVGNESGLGSFHTVQPEDMEPSNTPKIVGALAVALLVGAAGFGLYANSGSSSHPKPVVMASNSPAPSVTPTGAAAPAPEQTMQATKAAKAATTDPNSLRAALVKTPVSAATDKAPAPTKTASVKPARSVAPASQSGASARMAADSNQTTQAPAQQSAVAPTAPAPSPSSVTSNSTQSGVAVPPGATSASDIPATSNTAPAPDQQGATPAQPDAPAAGQANQ